jgi:uncharacterized membrane protein
VRDLAAYLFGLLSLTALACWYLASTKGVKQLHWLAVALAAGAGFAVTIAIGIDDTLCSLLVAALAASGFALRTWQVDYLRRRASREDDKTSEPIAIATAAILVTISATMAATWLYLRKRLFKREG